MFFAQTTDWIALGRALLADLVAQFADNGLRGENFALVLVAPNTFGSEGFAHRGDAGHYAAGLAAPFHLIHALSALQDGRIAPHADLDSALRDMMQGPSDTATNYVIDCLTGTTGDTVLHGAEYLDWASKRRRLGAFFWQLGWPEWDGCRLVHKQIRDLPYGREARLMGAAGDGLNTLTPLCAARLLWQMFEGDLPLGPGMLRRAQGLMLRPPLRPSASAEPDVPGYGLKGCLAGDVPDGVRIWSKSAQTGWTGDARTSWINHDMLRLTQTGLRPLYISLMSQSRAMADASPSLLPAMGRLIWHHCAPHLHLPSLAQQGSAPNTATTAAP